MTAVEDVASSGWSDPGADSPEEWAEALERSRSRGETEEALAGLVQENNELRAIVRSLREYAQCVRQLADEYARAYRRQHDSGSSYMAHLYNEVASAVERRIGDRP